MWWEQTEFTLVYQIYKTRATMAANDRETVKAKVVASLKQVPLVA